MFCFLGISALADYDKYDVEEAYGVSSNNYTETEIRTAIRGLAFYKQVLGLTASPLIYLAVAAATINLTWSALQFMNRQMMINKFNTLSQTGFMKVTFMWTNVGVISRTYTNYSSMTTFPNPQPGYYGVWHTGVITIGGTI